MRVALAAAIEPPCTLMVPVLLTYVPAVPLVTFTVISQLPEAGMVPPVSASDVPLLTVVSVPPQVLVGEALAVFFIFAGYVSVKATCRMLDVFGLVSVMVMTDV